ncbi:MAG: hypothetical protein Q8N18_05345 [Opitutaceae bacterium]|nr:hypothetical protein [Opitutaceae bacterium]
MQSALTVFWILSGLGFAAGVVITVVGLVRAPEGFEDESGFQYAESPAARKAKLADAGHAVRPSEPELA